MDKASRSRVLLEALAKVPADDPLTAEKLLGLLLSQPAETLRKERDDLHPGDRRRLADARSCFAAPMAPSCSATASRTRRGRPR